MALKITISEDQDIVILELAGRIDSFAIDDLNQGFDKAMKTGRENILLIMRDLEYINSRGIGAFMSFFKWVKKVGRLVKVAEVPLNIMQVLNLLGLDGLTLIYDSAADAVGSFRRRTIRKEEPAFLETPDLEEREKDKDAPRGNSTPKVLLGGMLLLICAVFAMLMALDSRTSGEVDLEPINRRLELLEGRLARLEAVSPAISPDEARIEEITAALTDRVERMARALDDLKAQATSGDGASAAKPAARYHKVRQGESLYGICRQYGISISELSRLNDISSRNTIYPGQMLIVGFFENRGE